MIAFDPMSPEFLADSNAVFKEYRESAGACRHEDVWPGPVVSVLRHEDVKLSIRDAEAFSNYVPPEFRHLELGDAISMAGEDDPVHARIRGAVSQRFTGRAFKGFEPTVRTIVEQCFDEAFELGEVDMVEGVAAKIASRVIATMLGVPVEDAGLMRDWTRVQSTFNGASFWLTGPDDPNIERYTRITAEIGEQMQDYFAALYDERAARPKDDLISEIVASDLERQEGIALAKMLMLAGNDTTMTLMNNIAMCLIDHPDQERLVRAEPDRIPAALEETLRFAPSIRWNPRTATRDCEIAGVPINKDEGVVFWIGSANRDARVFTNPDAFDIARPREAPMLAFGGGIHVCLGLILARMEGRVFLETLVARTTGMERTKAEMPPIPTPAFFGVTEQLVKLQPA